MSPYHALTPRTPSQQVLAAKAATASSSMVTCFQNILSMIKFFQNILSIVTFFQNILVTLNSQEVSL